MIHRMKLLLQLLTLVSVLALAGGCAQIPTKRSGVVNFTGQWEWVCCEGKYQGKMFLEEGGSGELAGRFYDEKGAAVGTIQGNVNGREVRFTRVLGEDFRQLYVLRLTADDRKLVGRFFGTSDESVSTYFEAARK